MDMATLLQLVDNQIYIALDAFLKDFDLILSNAKFCCLLLAPCLCPCGMIMHKKDILEVYGSRTSRLPGKLFFLGFLSVAAVVVYAQDDQSGLISIDCGIPEGSNYTDAITGIQYISDKGFIDTGMSRTFDMHLGVEYWDTITFPRPLDNVVFEIIHIPTSDYINICFINTGYGTPFVSSLELRSLSDTIYVTKSGSLRYFLRWDLGSTTDKYVRNLSSSGLTSVIAVHIYDLKIIQSLDLLNNNLTGQVPDFLSQLASLRVLKLNGNNFTGSVPAELLKKSKNGWLSLRRVEAELNENNNTLETKNRQFTYSEVLSMTNNFQRVIGKGGFGTVYHGYHGATQVAVKMLSPSSIQGYKEFQSEASLLTNIHHKNLTSFVGYCNEGTNLGIIYEYMAKGNLDKLLSVTFRKRPGYLDPEYYRSNRLTEKSDVYGFGIVLLEIVTVFHASANHSDEVVRRRRPQLGEGPLEVELHRLRTSSADGQ
ncbi:hypothetical protein LguiB_020376 [Lonicera macranthoides]